MGTTDQTINIIKNSLCKVTAEGDSYVSAEVTADNKLKLTSLKPGTGHVAVRTNDTNFIEISKEVTVTVQRADGKLSIQPATLDISGDKGTSMEATLSITGDGEITYSGAEHTTVQIQGTSVTVTSVTEGTDNITISMAQTDNYTAASCSLKATVVFKQKKTYGVEYTGTSSTKLTRTDDAALLGDPTPALNGVGGSSPFDNLEPWSKMQKSTQNGSVMVSIPKFWFKFTDNGSGKFKLQISTYEQAGFHVSPAHADRKDGTGERDVVYVERYHCASDWKSKAGEQPLGSKTRADFRTGVKTLGTGWYMMDWPMWVTIQMLYLVEFADFDSQTVIGYGGSNDNRVYNTGTTDNMLYHTGTMCATRTEYGKGIQYKWIEDLWSNVYDWVDGIIFDNLNIYTSMDINNYSDSIANYINIGQVPSSSGYIKYMGFPTIEGFEWAWYPKERASGAVNVYVSDNPNIKSDSVVCYVGGYYGAYQSFGLFYYGGNSISSIGSSIGSRLIYLPS